MSLHDTLPHLPHPITLADVLDFLEPEAPKLHREILDLEVLDLEELLDHAWDGTDRTWIEMAMWSTSRSAKSKTEQR